MTKLDLIIVILCGLLGGGIGCYLSLRHIERLLVENKTQGSCGSVYLTVPPGTSEIEVSGTGGGAGGPSSGSAVLGVGEK